MFFAAFSMFMHYEKIYFFLYPYFQTWDIFYIDQETYKKVEIIGSVSTLLVLVYETDKYHNSST